MTAGPDTPAGPAELEAARLLLARLGVSPADLLQVAPSRPPAPTFAEYIPVVAAAISDGSRRAYSTYWNRVLEQWADRRLDEVKPSDIERLVEHVKAHVVVRSNARGGRSAAENLITALRCVYRRAVADVDCCLTWSLALIGARVRRTHPELQGQLGNGSMYGRANLDLLRKRILARS